MSYSRRPPRKPAAAPSRPPAAVELMATEHDDRPFGSHGEMLPRPAPRPAAARPPQPLVIEPPPWQADPMLALQAAPAPNERPHAVAALKAKHGDDQPPDFVLPAQTLPPLQRFVPPEVDWRAEEAARAAGEQAS